MENKIGRAELVKQLEEKRIEIQEIEDKLSELDNLAPPEVRMKIGDEISNFQKEIFDMEEDAEVSFKVKYSVDPINIIEVLFDNQEPDYGQIYLLTDEENRCHDLSGAIVVNKLNVWTQPGPTKVREAATEKLYALRDKIAKLKEQYKIEKDWF